jgi:tetratricopeptide (TPR) repeat protein
MSGPANARNAPIPPKEKITAELDALLQAGKLEAALRLMDSLPPKLKNEPFMRFTHASVLMEYGDMQQSGEILMELQKQYPHFVEVNLPLAGWYAIHAWPAHASRAAQKVLGIRDFDAMGRDTAQYVLNDAKMSLDAMVEKLNLPFDKVEQACWHDENGQMAALDFNHTEAEYQARQALKIAPHWNSARNNHAYSNYFLGKCSEAITECEGVLANDPFNLYGLRNLAIFHAGLAEEEKAKIYADRLFTLWKSGKLNQNTGEVDIFLSVLGTLEDTDRIWQVFQQYKNSPQETLDEFSWDTFGVAAARLGHFKDAKKLLEGGGLGNVPDQNGISLMEKIDEAIKSKEKKLIWPPPYPVFIMFLPEHVASDLLGLIEKIERQKSDSTPSQQKKLKEFYSRYPFILQGFAKMMWTEVASAMGVIGLLHANQPKADAEIIRFALSDCGDDESRMNGISKLGEAGRYTPDESMRFWNVKKQEWMEVQFFSQRVGDFVPDIKPESLRFIREASETKNRDVGIAILRRVLEKDPTCAMAWYNLGVFTIKQGNEEEGVAYMQKSVEVDPNYAFGHANLALRDAEDGNEAAAFDHLQVVQKAKVITPQTASVSSYAHMIIHIDKGNLEEARNILETVKEINPGHKALKHYEEVMKNAEEHYESNKLLFDYQRNSRRRFHQKTLNTELTDEMTLEKCLSQLTNETLSSICEFWRTITYGKKNEMVKRLNERILDADILEELLKELNKKELEALNWVLDGGGWRTWNEFATKYGSDLDESPFWKYHEPQTVLGCLKRAALLFTGTMDDQRVAFIPADLRALLANALMS